MGTFRTLSAGYVGEILTGYGLHGCRGHRAIAASPIHTHLAFELSQGHFVRRVNEGKALPDVEREARIVDQLSARGVPTTPARRPHGGEPWLTWRGLHISLFPWVRGQVLGRAEIGPSHARQ